MRIGESLLDSGEWLLSEATGRKEYGVHLGAASCINMWLEMSGVDIE